MNTNMQNFERDTLKRVINAKALWLTHVLGNATLTVGFFYWTRIPDATGVQFLLTVVSGFVIVFLVLWLHAATFDYFGHPGKGTVKEALSYSVARVPAFLLWTIVFGLGLWLIGQVWEYYAQAGGWARHALPGVVRPRVTPRSGISATYWLIWFFYFIFWPAVSFSIAAQVAMKGFRGFVDRASLLPLRQLRFWMIYLICFLVGAFGPYRIAWMTPVPTETSTLNAQTGSMVVRLGFAYLLMVTAWLVLCAAILRAGEETRGVKASPEPEPINALPAV